MDLSEVRVEDVDGDGLDDLLIESARGLLWSSRGASCWRPIEPGGEPLSTRLSKAAVGNFTTPYSDNLEVVEINDKSWTLFSTNGMRRTIERSQRIKYFQTFQDGPRRRIFVILEDGSWGTTPAGDPLGEFKGRSSGSMGVSEARLVDNRDVYAFKDGELIYVPLALAALSVGWPISKSNFRRVFKAGGRGPLPDHVKSIDDLWLVHLDRRGSSGNDRIDLLSWDTDHIPILSLDIVESTRSTMNGIHYVSGAGVDLRHQTVVGYFDTVDTVSFLTLGEIRRNPVTKSDVFGFGTHYTEGPSGNPGGSA